MLRKFPSFRSKKEDYLWRWSKISEKIFRKITVPFDFQPKFPEIFLVNGKHPVTPFLLEKSLRLDGLDRTLILATSSKLGETILNQCQTQVHNLGTQDLRRTPSVVET